MSVNHLPWYVAEFKATYNFRLLDTIDQMVRTVRGMIRLALFATIERRRPTAIKPRNTAETSPPMNRPMRGRCQAR